MRSFCTICAVGGAAGRGNAPSRYTTATGGNGERTPPKATIP